MFFNLKNKYQIYKYYIVKYICIFLIIIFVFPTFLFVKPKKINAITLQELSNNISKLSSDEQNLLQEVVATETKIQQKSQQIANYENQLNTFNEELKGLYAKTAEIKKNISELQDKIQIIAVKSYKYNSDRIAILMINAKNLNEAATIIFLYRRIIKESNNLIEELKDEKERYDMTYRKSEEMKNKIIQLKDDITKERDSLNIYLKQKQDMLAQVKSEKANFITVLEQIKERIRQIQPPGLVLTGEWDMVATAYYSGGGGLNGNGITAIGFRVKKGIVAVDPSVIPLGTKLYIPGYGEAIAADTGGWIKGNRIDLAFESLEDCYRYGRRKIKVYLVQN